jgi:hypothetical protein
MLSEAKHLFNLNAGRARHPDEGGIFKFVILKTAL